MNAEILFTQRLLQAQGIYKGTLDGRSGVGTAAAIAECSRRSIELAVRIGKFDERTEGNIATLHLGAQEAARLMLAAVAGKLGQAVVVKILSGTRTYAEQDALYAHGRGDGGHVVTKAKGGESNHNFGIAWDVGVFDHGRYLDDSPLYATAAEIALAAVPRLEWGGNWQSIKDMPHFQLATGFSLRETRARFEAGHDYVTPA